MESDVKSTFVARGSKRWKVSPSSALISYNIVNIGDLVVSKNYLFVINCACAFSEYDADTKINEKNIRGISREIA